MKIKSATGWAVVDKKKKLRADNVWISKKQAKLVGNKIIKVKIVPVNEA